MYHEAGHAVVGLHLGMSLRFLEVKDVEDRAGGTMFTKPGAWCDLEYPNARTREWVLNRIVMGWAGTLAEENAGGTADDLGIGFGQVALPPAEVSAGLRDSAETFFLAAPGSDIDHLLNFAEALAIGPDEVEPLLEWLRRRSLAMLRKHWTDVELVATELERAGRLSGRRVRALLRERQGAEVAVWRQRHEARATARQ